MGTVSAFGDRRPAGQAPRGDMARSSASAPRGVIGAGLFLLISVFLLAAGGVPSAPDIDPAAHGAGAFLLDPSVTPAAN